MTLFFSKAGRAWMWALPLLLLAAALVIPALGRDVFDVDESATMIGAGARHLGPYSPAEAVGVFVSRWPDHPWGYVVIYSLWGRFVGWSELAQRALPWFAGLLTLAWVYRTGRDLFTLRIALTATLLMATSVVFLTYMHKARPYAPAMLFAAITLWAYWRVALHPRPTGRGAELALLTGAAGLLYTHYFYALLLPALALFHLFFVRKERHWWRPVLLLGLATLLALPQVPDLMSGIAHNEAKEHLHAEALHYPQIVSTLFHYLSNGLLNVSLTFSALFALALPLPLLVYGWLSRRHYQPPVAAWYLSLTSVLLLLFLLGASEWLQIFEEKRIRYLLTLWPPVMLLLGMALVQWPRTRQIRAVGVALAALLVFSGASNFQSNSELTRFAKIRSKTSVSVAATRALAVEGSGNGLLAVDRIGLFGIYERIHEFYTGAWGEQRVSFEELVSPYDLLERAQGQELVWLLFRSSNEATLVIPTHLERFRQQGWFHCRSTREAGVTLELLLPPLSAATLDQARLQFESDIELFAPAAPALRDGLLRFQAGLSSVDDTLLSRYSLAVHVVDSRTGERMAQGDTGVGPGSFVPLCREIDVSALPPGDYEVHVALYDWQTGERLSARDLETDEVSDMHMLHHFRIG